MKKFIYFAAAALVFASAASCEQNGGETDITNPYDEQFAKIADRFVNETVIPTYEALSTSTAELESSSRKTSPRPPWRPPARNSLKPAPGGKKVRPSFSDRPRISEWTLISTHGLSMWTPSIWL